MPNSVFSGQWSYSVFPIRVEIDTTPLRFLPMGRHRLVVPPQIDLMQDFRHHSRSVTGQLLSEQDPGRSILHQGLEDGGETKEDIEYEARDSHNMIERMEAHHSYTRKNLSALQRLTDLPAAYLPVEHTLYLILTHC